MNVLKNINYETNNIPPEHKWKKLLGYYKPYRGLFIADMFFAFLGAAVSLSLIHI